MPNSRAEQISALRSDSSKLGSALYRLSNERHTAAKAAQDQIRPAFKNARVGLRQATLQALSGPDVRLVSIDLRGPNGGMVNGARLVIRVLRIEMNGTPEARIVADDGADLGALTQDSLTEWPRRSNDRKDLWTDLSWDMPSAPVTGRVILPLAGAMLMQHGTFRAMAQVAKQIVSGGSPEIERLRAIDGEVEGLLAVQEELARTALLIATAGFDLEELRTRHAAIHRMMKSHDWTYDYADRPSRQSGEHYDQMLQALAVIPEDEALALWQADALAPMGITPWPARAIENYRPRAAA